MLLTRISKRKIVLLLFDKTSDTQNHAPSLFQECNFSLQASTENKTDMRKQASLGQDEVELGDLSFLMLQEKLRPWVPSSRVQMGHMRVACLHHIFSLSALPLSPQVHSICNNPSFYIISAYNINRFLPGVATEVCAPYMEVWSYPPTTAKL